MQNNTIFWARLLGLYAFIVSIWCFQSGDSLHMLLNELANNPLMLMNFGIFTILLGLAIVVSHSVFHGWPLAVTVLGYYVTLKGIVLLFFPHWVSHVAVFWQDKSTLVSALPAFIIGLLLLYVGFVRHH